MLNIISIAFGLGTSILLCVAIIRNSNGGPSFASFLMWGVMNAIITLSILIQGGNWYLSGLYTFTSFAISFCIFVRFGSSWTEDDTQVALCVLVSMLVWYLSGPWWATISSTAAVMFAGIPQLKDVFINPNQQKAWPWIGFGVANLCSVLVGKEWSVIERLYPSCCFLFSLLLVVCIFRVSRRSFRESFL